MTRNEHDANLALIPLERVTWTEPSRCKRKPVSMLRRILNLIGL